MMSLRISTKDQLAADLELIDEAGAISDRALARILRRPLGRWGLTRKRTLLKQGRDELAAAGLVEGDCLRVLTRLTDIGECAEVHVSGDVYIAPAEPRWIPIGDDVASYLSVADLPEGIEELPGGPKDVVRRFRLRSGEETARLALAGVRPASIADWLSPLTYHRHAARRLQRSAMRSDSFDLAGFWDLLEADFARESLTVSEDAEVRAVVGKAGDHFGRHDAPEVEGRWTTDPPNGLWCAFRRGYGESHWHPSLLSIEEDRRRILDLYDQDEWRWALMARSRRVGPEEEIVVSDESIGLTFPLPRQISAALDIMGVRTSAWTWDRQPGSPDLWSLVT